jgi:hypothetical protein
MENRGEGPMKRVLHFGVAAILALALSGCGDGHGRTVFVAQIVSDPGVDGYIAEDINSGSLFSPVTAGTPGVGFVRVGINPFTGVLGTEYRGFFHFPLDGSTGDAIPGTASILSATLEIFINSVQFNTFVPTRMDLISFPPLLVSTDYDVAFQPPILTRGTFNILSSDAPRRIPVQIDVTPLMREAQLQQLPDFQVRLLLPFDPPGATGLFEIDDGPADTAPLLIVEYE